MSNKQASPSVPPARSDTARRRIMRAIIDDALSSREISQAAGVSQRDVEEALDHIEKTARAHGGRLEITPARCRHCGFVFAKRERHSRPGRCPRCRHSSIDEPLFRLNAPRLANELDLHGEESELGPLNIFEDE